MKLDDIDRERYTLAMLALGWAYAQLHAKRAPLESEMNWINDVMERIYDLNKQAEK